MAKRPENTQNFFQELRDFVTRKGVNVLQHFSHRTLHTFIAGVFVEPDERDKAVRHAIDIRKGNFSIAATDLLPPNDS